MSMELTFPDSERPAVEITKEQQGRFVEELYALQQIAARKTAGLSLVSEDIPLLDNDIKVVFGSIQQEVAHRLQSRGLSQLGTRIGLSGIVAVPNGDEFNIEEIDEDVYIQGTIAGSRLELLPDVEGVFESAKQRVIPSVMIRLNDVTQVLTDESGSVVFAEPLGRDVYVPLGYSGIEPFLLPIQPIHKKIEVKIGERVVDTYRQLFGTNEQQEMLGPEDFEMSLLSVENQESQDRELTELLQYVQTVVDLAAGSEAKKASDMTPDEVINFATRIAPRIVSILEDTNVIRLGMPFLTSGPGLIGIAENARTINEQHLVAKENAIVGLVKTFSILAVPSREWVNAHLAIQTDEPVVRPCEDLKLSFAVVLEQARYHEGARPNGRPGRKINLLNHTIVVPAVYRMPTKAVREIVS